MASTVRTDKVGPVSGSADFTLPTADGTAGQFLKTDGSLGLGFATVASTGLNSVQKFTASGTWTRPTDITKVIVEVQAGGGGAGTAGQPYPSTNEAGWGGAGIQAPTTFRDPNARYGGNIPGGDPSGQDWAFSGGGGGGGQADPAGSYGGSYVPGSPGRTPGGPYYGAGSGALDPPAPITTATPGATNTGGGGGGGSNGVQTGGNGGSGIVLIAYPT